MKNDLFAFRRARMMMASIEAIASRFASDMSAQQQALNALGEYRSHGKNKTKFHHRPGAQMAGIRAARKARNVRRHRAACR